MKVIRWTVLVTIFPFCVFGQNMKKENRNHECRVTKKYTAEERLRNYPFNVAHEVKLVSFSYQPDSMMIEHRLPETDGKVDLTKMNEVIILEKTKIDSLTHILFDVGNRGKTLTSEVIFCYNPRNAILFIDSSGQPFEFIELCFECNGQRLSSTKIKTGEFCNQKYDMIKSFFLKQGIEIGTIKE